MKTVTIKKNSWHLWLAKHGADYDPREVYNPDRCTYVRKVIRGFVTVAFVAFLGVLFLGAIANTVAWWVYMLLHGYMAPSTPIPALVSAMLVILAVGAAIAVSTDKIKEARREAAYRRWREADGDVPEGFLTMAWKSFKEKTCARIVVED